MLDPTHVGWLLGDDYEVAARMRRQRDQAADPDQPVPADVQARRDLLGELLTDSLHRDNNPPTAPR